MKSSLKRLYQVERQQNIIKVKRMENKINYDGEEIEILDNFQSGNLFQSKSVELDKKIAQQCAENTIEK